MMEVVINLIVGGLVLAGSAFVIVAGIGILRMPDVFTRLHAAGVLDTLGAGLILLGLMFEADHGALSLKLLLLLGFLLATCPVASHALAKAALHDGQRPLAVEVSDELSKKSD